MTIQKTSWGYIRNTDISGYLTIEQLLFELVSTVRYAHVTATYVAITDPFPLYKNIAPVVTYLWMWGPPMMEE